jgi:hypothetical protein
MKKHIFLLLSVIATLLSCSTFDHSAILEQLRDHEARIQKLETLCNQLNSNVEAIQAILKALEQNDYITDVTKITEAGVEIGYSITFAKGGTVNIYHGSNGEDAEAPRIGIRKSSDGEYYWTSGDEWLTDENGEKLPATYTYGSDGGNESDVRYITPLFRIVENEWYISYDNGNTWRTMQALTDEGSNILFESVEYDSSYLYVTLSDGAEIRIPRCSTDGVSPKMMHFSFDDTIASLRDLTEKSASYASIFDQPFFSVLKQLHDQYGTVFSCYCFYQILNVDDSSIVEFSLEDVTDSYAREFAQNSSWLKFGFHSLHGSMNYAKETAENAKSHYDNFIKQIVRITGSADCIDLVVRLQNFAGNIESCRAMRDCACGVLGLLAGDYSETSTSGNTSFDDYTVSGYYLGQPARTFLARKGRWFDSAEQLYFYPSCLRLDNLISAKVTEYVERFNTPDRYGRNSMLIMYCHENQMYRNGSINTDYEKRIAKACEWAITNGYTFGYPMNKIRMAY